MANAMDLVGKQFGKLKVVERAENNKRGNTQWKCVCECGKTKIALGYDLTHGRTVSCGCNLKGTVSNNRISLVGKKYGTLTVVSLNESRTNNGVLFWDCKCDCGKEVVVSGANLKGKKNPSHVGCPFKGRSHNYIELAGKRFGRLVVKRIHGKNKSGDLTWECVCDCGNTKITTGENLKSGRTKSCGCLLDESRRKSKNTTHNMTNTKIYKLYRSMIERCSPNYHEANSYFKKGVCVCDEWLGENGFSSFYKWARKNGYAEDKTWREMTLDRIDVNGNYCPENCRWTDTIQQNNNKTNNAWYTYHGETKTLAQWSRELGLSYGALKARRRKGIEPPELFYPIQK